MISKKINTMLNQQVAYEFGAAYKYLAMSLWFEDQGLKIFAKRFQQQADEEREHAMRITKFIQETGGKVELEAVAKPDGKYASARAAVEAALDSEKTVTKQVHELMAAADAEKDYPTRSFLKWFVDEQVEEEASMNDLLQLLDMAGEKNLFQVETRLGQSM